MSACKAAILFDRTVLRVSGADARKFLQGLITNNIDKVQGSNAVHAALLTPQGKILFDFFVVGAEDGFLLDCAKEQAAELAKRLGFYKLRAAVEIGQAPEFAIAAFWGAAPERLADAVIFADPRLAEAGLRAILPADADLPGEAVDEADYHAMRIGLGLPEGGRDYAFGDTFPHEAMLDQLNGVDFAKGCFVGQEVVSRMQHRGTARKRVVPVEADAPLPAPGTEIEADGTSLGALGSVHGQLGLAMLRLDRAEVALAAGKTLKAGEISIRLRKVGWLRIPLPAPVAQA
jgi:tRNA-modifying protein YgfZ